MRHYTRFVRLCSVCKPLCSVSHYALSKRHYAVFVSHLAQRGKSLHSAEFFLAKKFCHIKLSAPDKKGKQG